MKQQAFCGNEKAPLVYSSDWFSCMDTTGSVLGSTIASAVSFSFSLSRQQQTLYAVNFPFPRIPYLVKKRTQEMAEITKNISTNYCAKMGDLARHGLSTEVFPYLGMVVTPTIRSVHFSVFSLTEKDLVKKTAAIQNAFRLRYSKKKDGTENTSESLQLYPPLDVLNNFSHDQELSNFLSLPFFSQTSEKIGSLYDAKTMNNGEGTKMVQTQRSKLTLIQKQAIISEMSALNVESRRHLLEQSQKEQQTQKVAEFLQKRATMLKPEQQVKRDFFGRVIEQVSVSQPAQLKPKNATGVTFKFQEGFTNAVKRKALVSDFL
jgi:ribosomal protein S18